RRALPFSSNSTGRFLKHMDLVLPLLAIEAGELVDVHAARVGLLAVPLGLVDGAAVLEPLIEEGSDLGAQRRLARLAGEGARDLAGAVPDGLAVPASHRHPTEPPDRRAVRPRRSAGHERARGGLVEGRELVGE